MSEYDYLVVGAGLFGAVFVDQAKKVGKKCLVIDKRNHIGGNCFTENIEGIEVHKYGAHIFRTNSKEIWAYLNSFDEFNNFINSPLAFYKGKLFNLPFNMNTFYQIWGLTTPEQVERKIAEQRGEIGKKDIENLEEKAISLVGRDVYEILIKGYTEKQWGRECRDLPSSIIRRLPFRLTFDNNYFNDRYQGVPEHGYTYIINKMLEGAKINLNVNFNADRDNWIKKAKKIIYTAPIDELCDYKYGPLEYRGLFFQHKVLNERNHQGVAVVNFTEKEVPYTRKIEHKHFVFGTQEKTVVSWEYPSKWNVGDDPYYPINDENNNSKYKRYLQLVRQEYPNIKVGGRLGQYQYFDMQDTINQALELAKSEKLVSSFIL